MPNRARYAAIEDKHLVAAALAERGEAYDELVRRYRGAVTLLAFRAAGSWDAAQDIVQEAFMAAYQQLAQLKNPAQFGPWVRVIAQNRARQWARRESRTEPVEHDTMDLLAAAQPETQRQTPEQDLLQREQDRALWDLVAALPAPTQTVLQLYYCEQWSVAQIAAFLSLTQTTVKWRLHSGRGKIHSALYALVSGAEPTDGAREKRVDLQHRTGASTDGKEQKAGDKTDTVRTERDRLSCRGR